MGLREAGVPGVDARGHPLAQPCRDDGALLGGAGAGDPAALELITGERHANNISLASLIAQHRAQVPVEVPAARKTA
jgi:hypothetical protein